MAENQLSIGGASFDFVGQAYDDSVGVTKKSSTRTTFTLPECLCLLYAVLSAVLIFISVLGYRHTRLISHNIVSDEVLYILIAASILTYFISCFGSWSLRQRNLAGLRFFAAIQFGCGMIIVVLIGFVAQRGFNMDNLISTNCESILTALPETFVWDYLSCRKYTPTNDIWQIVSGTPLAPMQPISSKNLNRFERVKAGEPAVGLSVDCRSLVEDRSTGDTTVST
jgi:hypothetical protein